MQGYPSYISIISTILIWLDWVILTLKTYDIKSLWWCKRICPQALRTQMSAKHLVDYGLKVNGEIILQGLKANARLCQASGQSVRCKDGPASKMGLAVPIKNSNGISKRRICEDFKS